MELSVLKKNGYEICSMHEDGAHQIKWDDNYDILPVGATTIPGDEWYYFLEKKWIEYKESSAVASGCTIYRRAKPDFMPASKVTIEPA